MLRKGFMLVVFGLLILVAASSSTFAADITGVWQYESMPDSVVTPLRRMAVPFTSARTMGSMARRRQSYPMEPERLTAARLSSSLRSYAGPIPPGEAPPGSLTRTLRSHPTGKPLPEPGATT